MPTLEQVQDALDELIDLSESFLEHWENDEDPEEQKLASEARGRYEHAKQILLDFTQ